MVIIHFHFLNFAARRQFGFFDVIRLSLLSEINGQLYDVTKSKMATRRRLPKSHFVEKYPEMHAYEMHELFDRHHNVSPNLNSP